MMVLLNIMNLIIIIGMNLRNKTQNWIYINEIRFTIKFRGNGSRLLHQFIESLPVGTGIVLNAYPIDNDITFEKLQAWYIKQKFQQISKNNISLFYLKISPTF